MLLTTFCGGLASGFKMTCTFACPAAVNFGACALICPELTKNTGTRDVVPSGAVTCTPTQPRSVGQFPFIRSFAVALYPSGLGTAVLGTMNLFPKMEISPLDRMVPLYLSPHST